MSEENKLTSVSTDIPKDVSLEDLKASVVEPLKAKPDPDPEPEPERKKGLSVLFKGQVCVLVRGQDAVARLNLSSVRVIYRRREMIFIKWADVEQSFSFDTEEEAAFALNQVSLYTEESMEKVSTEDWTVIQNDPDLPVSTYKSLPVWILR